VDAAESQSADLLVTSVAHNTSVDNRLGDFRHVESQNLSLGSCNVFWDIRTCFLPIKGRTTSILDVASVVVSSTDHRITTFGLLDGSPTLGTIPQNLCEMSLARHLLLILLPCQLISCLDGSSLALQLLKGIGTVTVILLTTRSLPRLPLLTVFRLLSTGTVVVIGNSLALGTESGSAALTGDALCDRGVLDDNPVLAVGCGAVDDAGDGSDGDLEEVGLIAVGCIGRETGRKTILGDESADKRADLSRCDFAGARADRAEDTGMALEEDSDVLCEAVETHTVRRGTAEGVRLGNVFKTDRTLKSGHDKKRERE